EVYSALSQVITTHGMRSVPWKSFQTTSDSKRFLKCAPWLANFVCKSFDPRTKIEKEFCYLFVFKSLVTWMERVSIPISYRTMINSMDRIPTIIDDNFPGYRKAGL